MDIYTQIAIATARLSVLEGSDISDKACSDGMNSYITQGLKAHKGVI